MKKILWLAVALGLCAAPVWAAVTPNSVVTAQTPSRGVVQFLQGTDTAGTYKTLYTAGTNGSKITGMFATSGDTAAAHLITCQIVNTAVKYGGVAVNVPLNSGMATGVPPVNLMNTANWPGLPLDGNGNPYFTLVSGDTLQCTYATALTAATFANVVAVAADY